MNKALKKIVCITLCLASISTVFAQYKMRPVEELINKSDPGWVFVKQWIDSAKNQIEILEPDSAKAKQALYRTQVTTRSAMGAIVYNTGGILVDHGWIRILGSGCSKMQRTLPDWNKGKAFKEFGDRPNFFLIADDAAGGFFAINYGSIGSGFDSVYYLAPDDLEWEPLDMMYEDFIWFCFNGELENFYTGIRWKSWKQDMAGLKADEMFHIFPPLWTKEGKDIEVDMKKPVPAEELFTYDLEMRKQLDFEK